MMLTYLRNNNTDDVEQIKVDDYITDMSAKDDGRPDLFTMVPRMAANICTPAEFEYIPNSGFSTGMSVLKFRPTLDTLLRYPHLRNTEVTVMPMMFPELSETVH